MLKVTVELVPFGDESRTRTLGVAMIANTSSANGEKCDYTAEFHRFMEWDREGDLWQVELKGFERSRGFWQLLMECLKLGERKGHG